MIGNNFPRSTPENENVDDAAFVDSFFLPGGILDPDDAASKVNDPITISNVLQQQQQQEVPAGLYNIPSLPINATYSPWRSGLVGVTPTSSLQSSSGSIQRTIQPNSPPPPPPAMQQPSSLFRSDVTVGVNRSSLIDEATIFRSTTSTPPSWLPSLDNSPAVSRASPHSRLSPVLLPSLNRSNGPVIIPPGFETSTAALIAEQPAAWAAVASTLQKPALIIEEGKPGGQLEQNASSGSPSDGSPSPHQKYLRRRKTNKTDDDNDEVQKQERSPKNSKTNNIKSGYQYRRNSTNHKNQSPVNNNESHEEEKRGEVEKKSPKVFKNIVKLVEEEKRQSKLDPKPIKPKDQNSFNKQMHNDEKVIESNNVPNITPAKSAKIKAVPSKPATTESTANATVVIEGKKSIKVSKPEYTETIQKKVPAEDITLGAPRMDPSEDINNSEKPITKTCLQPRAKEVSLLDQTATAMTIQKQLFDSAESNDVFESAKPPSINSTDQKEDREKKLKENMIKKNLVPMEVKSTLVTTNAANISLNTKTETTNKDDDERQPSRLGRIHEPVPVRRVHINDRFQTGILPLLHKGISTASAVVTLLLQTFFILILAVANIFKFAADESTSHSVWGIIWGSPSVLCYYVFCLMPIICNWMMLYVGNLPHFTPHLLSNISVYAVCRLLSKASEDASSQRRKIQKRQNTSNAVSSIDAIVMNEHNPERFGNEVCQLILRLIGFALPIGFFLEGFSSGNSSFMLLETQKRLILAYLLSLTKRGLILSPISWVGWSLQVLLSYYLPSGSAVNALQFFLGLAFIRLVNLIQSDAMKHYH